MRQHFVWSEGQQIGGVHWTNFQTVPFLDTSAGKVGQCPTHLPRIAVVATHLNSPELHCRKWSVTVTLPRSNGTGRPLSSLILFRSRCRIPYPRVVRLSPLFVAAVQSCRRRCAVRRCSNTRIAIRNNSNRRWSKLVQASTERANDARLVLLSPDEAPDPSTSGRSPYNVNFVSLFTCATNFCVRKIISRVLVYHRTASWRALWDYGNNRLRSRRPFPSCRRVQLSSWRFECCTSRADSVSRWGHIHVSSWRESWHLPNCWRMCGYRTILPKLPFSCYDSLEWTQLDTSCVSYDDLLEFRFVKRAVEFITVPIEQTIHGCVGSVCVNIRKQFFCPVRHVSFFEVSFRFFYAYLIADSKLMCVSAFVTIQSLPYDFLIGAVYFWRSHIDTAVIGVIVRSHKDLQHVDVLNRLVFCVK